MSDLWRDKANRLILEMSTAAYKAANVDKYGRKRRKHVPYSIPPAATALVDCLNMRDQRAAEARAKAIFISVAGGVPTDSPLFEGE